MSGPATLTPPGPFSQGPWQQSYQVDWLNDAANPAHAETTDPASSDNSRPLPEAETAARYVELALYGNGGHYPDLPDTGWRPWLADERVVGVVFFAFNGHPAFWSHTNWLALNEAGEVLGTYAPFDKLVEISERKGLQKSKRCTKLAPN